VSQFPATHPVLAAQARIDDLLARAVGDFGIYTEHRLPAVAVLADVRNPAHRHPTRITGGCGFLRCRTSSQDNRANADHLPHRRRRA
jgi:hypothetical protein